MCSSLRYSYAVFRALGEGFQLKSCTSPHNRDPAGKCIPVKICLGNSWTFARELGREL